MVHIKEIINYLESIKMKIEFIGDSTISINKVTSINQMEENSISWIKKDYIYDRNLISMQNTIVVTNEIDFKTVKSKSSFIFCDNPREVYFTIATKFFPPKVKRGYISSTASVESRRIHPSAYIGHNSYVGEDVILGENVTIKNNVSLEGSVTVGDNTIIHSGVVIGTDGFGYYNNHENLNTKIEHYGGVRIGENVEIGANTCIDKGTLKDTEINDNVKISNMCNLSHNVKVEKNVLIAAGVLIAGSTIIKKNAYIAPGSTINNKLNIGMNSSIGSGSVVVKNVEKGALVFGVPAKEKEEP